MHRKMFKETRTIATIRGYFLRGRTERGMTVAIVQGCSFLITTSMPKYKILLLWFFINESKDGEKKLENFVELPERLFAVNALMLALFQSIRQLCNLLLVLSGLSADHGP
jgi:hypothetical protein